MFVYKSLKGPPPPLVPTHNYDEAQPDWVFPKEIRHSPGPAPPKRTQEGRIRERHRLSDLAQRRKEARQQATDAAVVVALKSGRMSLKELAKAIGKDCNACNRSLARLVQAGTVVRIQLKGVKADRPRLWWKLKSSQSSGQK